MKQEKIQREKDKFDEIDCTKLYIKTLIEIKQDIGSSAVQKKKKLQLKNWDKSLPMMKTSSLLTKRKHNSHKLRAFPKMFSNQIF
jgi:hypothetical protein